MAQNYFPFAVDWVGRGGFERRITAQVSTMYYDGRVYRIPNPDGTETREIIQVLAGLCVGLRAADVALSEQPPGRRVVLHPRVAAHPPAQLGQPVGSVPRSDFVNDDSSLWFGKNQSFNWKVVGQQDVLIQTASPNPVPIIPGAKWEGGQEYVQPRTFPGAVWVGTTTRGAERHGSLRT